MGNTRGKGSHMPLSSIATYFFILCVFFFPLFVIILPSFNVSLFPFLFILNYATGAHAENFRDKAYRYSAPCIKGKKNNTLTEKH